MKIAGYVCILTRDDEVLLQHRDDIDGIQDPGKWGLFGGGAEQGETPHEGITRELDEELDVDISQLQQWTTRPWRDMGHDIVFTATVDDDRDVVPVNEGQEGRFVTKDDIDGLDVIPEDRAILQQFFDEFK
jgi:8-oxo-dGTP pyrophosphatase MutT (NUDIX family)